MFGAGGIRAGAAFVELGLKNNIEKDLRRVQARFRLFTRNIASLGSNLFKGGLLPGLAVGGALKIFTSFSDEMLTVKAVSVGTEEQFAKLSETVKRLGRETSFTASEVASAAAALGRGGFNRLQIDSAIEDVLALSRATGTDLAQAADIAANTLRIFRKEASQTGNVADILTATANGSAQTLEDLFESLKIGGVEAAGVNSTLEQTAASLGVLANLGVKGSLAGTQLRKTFQQLATVKVQDKLKDQLNIEIDDAALADLPNTLAEIVRRSQNLSVVQRSGLFIELFGARAKGAAQNIGETITSVNEFQKKLEGVNGTARAAATLMDSGIGGAIRRLLSAVEGISIALGETLAPAVSGVAEILNGLASGLTQLIKQNSEWVISIATIIAGTLTLGAGLIGLSIALNIAGTAVFAVASTLLSVIFTLASFTAAVFGAVTSTVAFAASLIQGIPGAIATFVANMQIAIGSVLSFAASLLTSAPGAIAGFVANLQIAIGSVLAFVASLISSIPGAIATFAVNMQIAAGSVIAFAASMIAQIPTAVAAFVTGMQASGASAIAFAASLLSSIPSTIALFAANMQIAIGSVLAFAASLISSTPGAIAAFLVNMQIGIGSVLAFAASILASIPPAFVAFVASVQAAIVSVLAFAASLFAGGIPAIAAFVAGFAILAIKIALVVAAIVLVVNIVLRLSSVFREFVSSVISGITQIAGDIVNGLVAGFNSLLAAAKEAFGGIIAAIKAGNISAAFKVVTTSLNALWQNTLLALFTAWVRTTSGIQLVFSTMFGNLKTAALTFVRFILDKFNEILSSANSVAEFFRVSVPQIDTSGLTKLIDEERKSVQDIEDAIVGSADKRIAAFGEEAAAANEARKAAIAAANASGETTEGDGGGLLKQAEDARKASEAATAKRQAAARETFGIEQQILAARAAGDEEQATSLERELRIRREIAGIVASQGLSEEEARKLAEERIALEDRQASGTNTPGLSPEELARQQAARELFDLEQKALRARAAGNDQAADAIDRELRIRQQIAQIMASQGVGEDVARRLAEERIKLEDATSQGIENARGAVQQGGNQVAKAIDLRTTQGRDSILAALNKATLTAQKNTTSAIKQNMAAVVAAGNQIADAVDSIGDCEVVELQGVL